MVTHSWGDEWFEKHGADINGACEFIETYCNRYGRFGGQVKEKFGQVRFYVRFHYGLHDLIYPGYVHTQWGKILSFIDYKIYWRVLFDPVRRLIGKYQAFIYARAYKLAALKYPNIVEEIYCAADYPELLKKDFYYVK